ncbi:hypothetical protein OUZ56_023500 [Daphnia magna]|uniref:Uncharacterized protein n=1 Tax=Daphnia magna TaxID=35525 RepID=A0ABR0AZ71_9CRUS|nr:hypothetical protein OUZ56_023500 [Daphnia magna]
MNLELPLGDQTNHGYVKQHMTTDKCFADQVAYDELYPTVKTFIHGGRWWKPATDGDVSLCAAFARRRT